MIKTDIKTITDDSFIEALRGIIHQRMSSKTSYKISKISQFIEKTVKDIKPEFQRMAQECAEFKDGKPQPADKEGYNFKVKPEKEEYYKKFMEDLNKKEVQIPQNKIALSELSSAQLTPSEMLALEPILTELELVPGIETGNGLKT